MDDDLLQVHPPDLGHERQEAVPERKGVAGMEASVDELGDTVERQVVELEQLAGTGEMEEAVAFDVSADTPEQDAENDPAAPDPGATRRGGRR